MLKSRLCWGDGDGEGGLNLPKFPLQNQMLSLQDLDDCSEDDICSKGHFPLRETGKALPF